MGDAVAGRPSGLEPVTGPLPGNASVRQGCGHATPDSGSTHQGEEAIRWRMDESAPLVAGSSACELQEGAQSLGRSHTSKARIVVEHFGAGIVAG